ncbi:MAG TPA: hypothetical protein VFP10_15790, partial [Candidatus Eisenbacteria bacterium]|nr:hypothetical protein [Candidatus Eisenbacteria bacterium]
FVYRGQGIQPLRGRYVFGDAGSGRIWAISSTAPGSAPVEVETGVGGLSSFGEDFRGELYCAILNEGVFRIFDPEAQVPDVSLVSMLFLFVALSKLLGDSVMRRRKQVAPHGGSAGRR